MMLSLDKTTLGFCRSVWSSEINPRSDEVDVVLDSLWHMVSEVRKSQDLIGHSNCIRTSDGRVVG